MSKKLGSVDYRRNLQDKLSDLAEAYPSTVGRRERDEGGANGHERSDRPQEKERNVTFLFPESLIEQIRERAFHERKSQRTVMLEALRTAGFEVDERHLVADRRRRQ